MRHDYGGHVSPHLKPYDLGEHDRPYGSAHRRASPGLSSFGETENVGRLARVL